MNVLQPSKGAVGNTAETSKAGLARGFEDSDSYNKKPLPLWEALSADTEAAEARASTALALGPGAEEL